LLVVPVLYALQVEATVIAFIVTFASMVLLIFNMMTHVIAKVATVPGYIKQLYWQSYVHCEHLQ